MTMPAWSYSSLSSFNTCPKRYYLTRVTKQVKEPESDDMRWGTAVHKALELAIRDKVPLPRNMAQFQPVVDELEAMTDKWRTEDMFGLTEDLEPTEFFSRSVWVRGKLDVYAVNGNRAIVFDYKTGKKKPDFDQLKLFAAAIFHKYPHVDEIVAGFIWLQTGEKTIKYFHRDDLKEIWGHFMPQLQRMESAYDEQRWPPNPSGLCRAWCPVGQVLCSYCGEQ